MIYFDIIILKLSASASLLLLLSIFSIYKLWARECSNLYPNLKLYKSLRESKWFSKVKMIFFCYLFHCPLNVYLSNICTRLFGQIFFSGMWIIFDNLDPINDFSKSIWGSPKAHHYSRPSQPYKKLLHYPITDRYCLSILPENIRRLTDFNGLC